MFVHTATQNNKLNMPTKPKTITNIVPLVWLLGAMSFDNDKITLDINIFLVPGRTNVLLFPHETYDRQNKSK